MLHQSSSNCCFIVLNKGSNVSKLLKAYFISSGHDSLQPNEYDAFSTLAIE